jgi:hypothetical protein
VRVFCELEIIFELIAEGRSNREIAKVLGVSPEPKAYKDGGAVKADDVVKSAAEADSSPATNPDAATSTNVEVDALSNDNPLLRAAQAQMQRDPIAALPSMRHGCADREARATGQTESKMPCRDLAHRLCGFYICNARMNLHFGVPF